MTLETLPLREWGARWQPYRSQTMTDEVFRMPDGYRTSVGFSLGDRMRDFYQGQFQKLAEIDVLRRRAVDLSRSWGLHPEANLDIVARRLLEHRFWNSLSRRFGEPDAKLPPYYYGYFRGHDLRGKSSTVSLRAIGLLPPPDVTLSGVVLDLHGYGHGFEHDFHRLDQWLHAGFAVFTFDRLEHGLSSRWNPTQADLHSARVNVTHTRQFVEMIRVIQSYDERLRGRPLLAIAASVSGAYLVGALRAMGAGHGIGRIFFESPRWRAGSRYAGPKYQVGMPLVHTCFSRAPTIAAGVRQFFMRPDSPEQRGAMTADRLDYLNRYWTAGLGLAIHPPSHFDITKLDAVNRSWLASPEARNVLPPMMVGICCGDREVDSETNLEVLQALQRDGDVVRLLHDHSPFSVGGDPKLAGDVGDFLLNRLDPTALGDDVFIGPRAICSLAMRTLPPADDVMLRPPPGS